MRNFLASLLIVVLFGLGRASAQAPEVHSRFVPDTIMIGDQFTMEVDIDKDLAQEIQLPQFDDNQLIKGVEVVRLDGVDTLSAEGRRIRLRVNYRLTSFDEGSYTVAGFPVVYSDKNTQDTVLSPDPMTLVVGTFEIDTTKQDIFDIKRPMNTPLIWAEMRDIVLWGALGVVVLAAIIYFVVRYVQRRRGRLAPRRRVPPHVVAIRALERLHSRKLWQNGKHKEYYSTLADVVRVYIEERYGVGAMEMTSDQILDAMESINEERLREKLRELFSLSDLVKFAKMAPSPDDNEQAYFDAYFYVEETKDETPDPSVNTRRQDAEEPTPVEPESEPENQPQNHENQ